LVTRRSEDLSRLVAPGATYGYDLEVHIGLERYLHHRQREEIRHNLETRHGISISSGQVSILANRFLQHLESLHRSRSGAIREALTRDGGYPLHIDATGENGQGTLFVAYAGWRGWVLGSWKLPTERAELILPCLQEMVAAFGEPVALLRDLGRAMILAVEELVEELKMDIPILSCHLHFLRDVGNDLLKDSYAKLRDLARRFRLKSELRKVERDLGRRLGEELPTLRHDVGEWAESATDHTLPTGLAGLAAVRFIAQWILDYHSDGHHLDLPFDRPYLALYERCRTACRAIDAYLRKPTYHAAVRRALHRLARILDPVVSETSFASVAGPLSHRARLFDELRDALRLNPKRTVDPATDRTSANPPEQAAAELQDIRKSLDTLTRSLRQRRPERGPAQDTRQAIDIILDHLEKHGDSLWGHIIQLPEEAGGGIRVVARTNNCLENYFHDIKHGERRRSGRKALTRDLECLPAAIALAYNLTCPDYVQLLCGSMNNLPEAFARLDIACCAQAILPAADSKMQIVRPEPISASLPPADRPLVRTASLRKRIESAAKSRAPHYIPGGIWPYPTEF
jgi:hypothetical protein